MCTLSLYLWGCLVNLVSHFSAKTSYYLVKTREELKNPKKSSGLQQVGICVFLCHCSNAMLACCYVLALRRLLFHQSQGFIWQQFLKQSWFISVVDLVHRQNCFSYLIFVILKCVSWLSQWIFLDWNYCFIVVSSIFIFFLVV